MIAEDYEDDTHYCIKCHATILGLDNYVTHRKTRCGKALPNVEELPKSPLPSQLLPPDESFTLKADDFFSSLELQSSSKKISPHSTSGKNFSRILTRSKASAAIQASNLNREPDVQQSKSGKNAWIGGHQLKELGTGDNQTRLIKAVDNLSRNSAIKKLEAPSIRPYEESDDDSDDYYSEEESDLDENQDAPPRSHTGGKWKPSNSPVQWSGASPSNEGRDWSVPPINFTGGKWKPYSKPSRSSPPPTHTKGKWKPASPNLIKDGYDAPRPTYTGGKWTPPKPLYKTEYTEVVFQKDKSKSPTKPVSNIADSSWGGSYVTDYNFPPPGHTKGKWKPPSDDKKMIDAVPPPTHTKGKWLPTTKYDATKAVTGESLCSYDINASQFAPLRKSSGRVQYWCGPCNRRLASKVVHERHLRSDLHLKRTRLDQEFDDSSYLNTNLLNESKRSKRKPVEYWSHTSAGDNKDTMKNAGQETRRIRRRTYLKCEICRSRVHRQLIGKHLISHYHCRKGDITLPKAREMVLENIYSIVLQSPYQCATCRFYCNTQSTFLRHWSSNEHDANVAKYMGFFLCSFCKFETPTTAGMYGHLISDEHNEIISVINRSVPIIIKKINLTECQTCQQKFLLNIELKKHCEKEDHPYSNTCTDTYQSRHNCDKCDEIFYSKFALRSHKKNKHQDNVYFCSVCNLNFETLPESKSHRTTSSHRYAVLAKKNRADPEMKLTKTCLYCKQTFENMPLLKQHLKEEHPEHNHSCPHCGKTFTINQELCVHLRTKACSFQETVQSSNKCDQCPYSTESVSELLFHKVLHSEPIIERTEEKGRKSKHPVEKYKCPICHKIFAKLSLRCHIRLHTKERPYACTMCSASFVRKNNWALHMKNCAQRDVGKGRGKSKLPTGELSNCPYLCSTCGASFKKKSILQLHMTRHTGKLCKCPQQGCVFAARTPSDLKSHLLTHSDEKLFACPQCDYKGKTKKHLDRHSTVHEVTKKYQCSLCSFSSRLQAHLKRHMRLHTGAKPYSCPHCNYRCNNLENLRKHVLSTNKHPGKCIYECKFCSGRNFQTNFARDFKVHLVSEHSDMFQTGTEAATYVAGIYEASDDSVFIDVPADLDDKTCDTSKNTYQLEYENSVSVTPTSGVEECIVENKEQGDLFPMYIVSKDEVVCVENPTDTWNMVGSYDVEESGALVPFTPDGETLFQNISTEFLS